jgi:c(7)-type cytochrome triheme protein
MKFWFFLFVSILILLSADFIHAAGKEPQDIIVFKNQGASRKKAEMPPARFSHSIHNKKKLKCNNCHPSVFKEKIGANIVTMKKNVDGEYCGKCHNGQSAWDMSACRRCHV